MQHTTNDLTATTTATTAATGSVLPPDRLGIGMRLSLHPHCDHFVEVILGSLRDVAARGLDRGLLVETDEVSTWVGAQEDPAEQRLAAYLTALVLAASRRTGGGHVVAHVLLSRGCPGEVGCLAELDPRRPATPVTLPTTGLPATAQWSLYPLLDGGPGGDHMQHIESAISRARGAGVRTRTAHYATVLSGDLAQVLATAVDAWAAVGADVAHVVSHLTVSVGSPSSASSPASAGAADASSEASR